MTVHSLHISVPSTPPELVESSIPTSPVRTNTLVVTQLPPPFFEPVVLDALRDHFASYGEIHTWAPLKAFARAILVYYSEDDAELAKESCDSLVLGSITDLPETTIRVFRADPTPIADYDEHHPDKSNSRFLRPPDIEKNFLISPPGSPPVGWEQIREDPPNATPLAHDLIAALRKLHIQQEGHQHKKGVVEVLIEPEEAAGIGIYVEDCDGDEDVEEEPREEDWIYGQRPPSLKQWKPVTAMPPMSTVSA
ncbi:Calcipressin [Abortiporus biennis]|nr:Calcipressin [Abortiporus biennis]